MQISDISAYSDNARLYAGDRQVVEQSPGKVARNTQSKQSEQAVAGADADFSSSDMYKGNFIDTYA